MKRQARFDRGRRARAAAVARRFPKGQLFTDNKPGFVCSSAPTRLLMAERGTGGLRLNRKKGETVRRQSA